MNERDIDTAGRLLGLTRSGIASTLEHPVAVAVALRRGTPMSPWVYGIAGNIPVRALVNANGGWLSTGGDVAAGAEAD